jgi:UDP-4-amino-4-deoxy-L-arabinose-oxoglutarate aminotransferase
MTLIPHSKPWITDADVASLSATLRSGMVAQGAVTQEFEAMLSRWVGADGGVATASGGAAIVLALLALKVGDGDEVMLPTYVCPSVQEAVLMTGATPVLCDVGSNWVMTVENVSASISHRTRALIIPHMYGIFADVASFRTLGVPLIEDCAQAVDGQGKRNVEGDIAIFSFHPTKCLTAGEGGMAVAANPDLVAAMRRLRDGMPAANRRRFFSPLSDMSASLGMAQLRRYHQALSRRRMLGLKYQAVLQEILGEGLRKEVLERGMYFRFPIRIAGGLEAYQERFLAKHICVRRGVDRLLHRLGGVQDHRFPMSVALFETTLSLPLYPALTDDEHAHCLESAVEIFAARANRRPKHTAPQYKET